MDTCPACGELWSLILEVHLENTMHLLGLVLSIHLHHFGWRMNSVLRMLLQVKLPLGVVEVQLKVVELIRQKLLRRVAVRDRVLPLELIACLA